MKSVNLKATILYGNIKELYKEENDQWEIIKLMMRRV